jgi:hypothetical protein
MQVLGEQQSFQVVRYLIASDVARNHVIGDLP